MRWVVCGVAGATRASDRNVGFHALAQWGARIDVYKTWRPGAKDPKTIPEGPCTYIVYTWALKLLYGNPFKAQVYTR